MTFLIVKTGIKKFKVYCPDIYGHQYWETAYQEFLTKKRKYWYFSTWNVGDADYSNERKANVVLETTDVDDIFHYYTQLLIDKKITSDERKDLHKSAVGNIEMIFNAWVRVEKNMFN